MSYSICCIFRWLFFKQAMTSLLASGYIFSKYGGFPLFSNDIPPLCNKPGSTKEGGARRGRNTSYPNEREEDVPLHSGIGSLIGSRFPAMFFYSSGQPEFCSAFTWNTRILYNPIPANSRTSPAARRMAAMIPAIRSIIFLFPLSCFGMYRRRAFYKKGRLPM